VTVTDTTTRTDMTARRRLVVPWGVDLVEADVLRVTGSPPCVQVYLALAEDPAARDPAGPVEFILHGSELPADAMEQLRALREVRDAG
jgi:hypothetical protein